MKLKSIINALFMFFALIATTANINAQAYTNGEGGWTLNEVEFSADDQAAFVELLEQTDPSAYFIQSSGQTYGRMSMERVEATYQSVLDANPALQQQSHSICLVWSDDPDCLIFRQDIDLAVAPSHVSERMDVILRKYEVTDPRQ